MILKNKGVRTSTSQPKFLLLAFFYAYTIFHFYRSKELRNLQSCDDSTLSLEPTR